MSASELLKQVSEQLRELPSEEQERFFDEILDLEDSLPPRGHATAQRPLQWPDIRSRHRRIFGDVVLERNVVLAARDEEEH